MFWFIFLGILAISSGKIIENNAASNTSCVQLDLIFIIEESQSMVPFIYNENITNFVIDLAGQFSFYDEATTEKPGFARIGVITFSDTATVSIPLANYSRTEFNNDFLNLSFINDGLSYVDLALLAAYNEFQAHSIFSNRAIMLIVDDVSLESMHDAQDAMNKLRTIVNLPMGVIVPGYSGTTEEGFEHLKILFGNNSKLAFPDLDTALDNAPGFVTDYYPCQLPPACNALIFLEEATVVIGPTAKLSFLQLSASLAASLNTYSDTQRFGVGLFGAQILHNIEIQQYQSFNSTMDSLIRIMETNNNPDSGQTYLAPILNRLVEISKEGLETNFTVILLAETEAIKDPTAAFASAQKVAAAGINVYVLDRTRYAVPSGLFSTLTNNRPGHVINASFSDPSDFFNTLYETALVDFQQGNC